MKRIRIDLGVLAKSYGFECQPLQYWITNDGKLVLSDVLEVDSEQA